MSKFLGTVNTSLRPSVNKLVKHFVVRTCPHCLKDYSLGFDGVETGCDNCEGIVRLSNGMIDYGASSPEAFITKGE